MFGRKVVEGEQRLSVLLQTLGDLLVFDGVGLDKGVERRVPSFLVSAIQMSCSMRLAFGCWLLGNLLRILA
jgi:hypothetical protein